MKKILIPTLFLALAFLVALFAVAMLLSAQTQEQSTEAQLEEVEKIVREQKERVGLFLTELEILRLSVIVKDLLLAQQRIQNLQRNFQTTLAVVRKAHNAPEDKFIFNPNTMRFVPVPEKPKVKEE